MIAVAKETNNSQNVTFCTWDARTVGDNPEWRERFDKAVSFFVIHWVPDHMKAFESIRACLKPGGELLAMIIHEDKTLSKLNMFLKGHPKWSKYVQVCVQDPSCAKMYTVRPGGETFFFSENDTYS